jgi:predicted permease
LVVVEFALTTGLVLAAGLTVRSVLNLTQVREGFSAAGIMTSSVALPMAQVGISEAEYPDHTSRLHFVTRLLEDLQSRPGVEVATVTNVLPSQGGPVTALALEGRAYLEDSDYPDVRIGSVTGDYFALFGVEPIEGRTIDRSDVAGSEAVAVVNRSFANRHFSGESALFRRMRLGTDGSEPWVTIVGVVPDLWTSNNADRDLSRVFVPLAQSGTPDPTVRLGRWGLRYMTVAVRGESGSLPHAVTIRDAVAAVDANIPAYAARSMQQVLELRTGRYRLYGRYYLAFGIVALALAMIGLYGVMAFSVTRRKPEFGIRMALGAGATDVVRGVLRQAAAQIAMGLAAGVVVAIWLIQGLQEALFHVDLADPLVLAGVPLVLIATGLLASLVPALRASRVDPTDAMRAE